jgi:hypothetical protein
MRLIRILVTSAVIAICAAGAIAQNTPGAKTPKAAQSSPAPAPKALLPEAFAGWEAAGAPQKLADASQADAPNAAALKEYDFSEGVLGEYKRGGEELTLRALSFHDTSGAYGAYSYYRQNGWPRQEIGAGATSDHNRMLFWVGTTVVDASFSRIGPMSASDLRELAQSLPLPDGGKALIPPILADLPQSKLDGQTTHYAVGPAGYSGAGGLLPPELAGFDLGAEAVTANYSLRSGPATLTILDYPTPQLAAAQETKIRAYVDACKRADKATQAGWSKAMQETDLFSLEVKRSGPLVAIVSGDAVPDESHKLLALVHYDSDLTAIPLPGANQAAQTGKFLIGVVLLILFCCTVSILLAIFLGGVRVLYRKARGKPASSVFDEEFIKLNLEG